MQPGAHTPAIGRDHRSYIQLQLGRLRLNARPDIGNPTIRETNG